MVAKIKIYARPASLYRYRSLTDESVEREIQAIVGNYVFCTRYEQMNDPMEGNHREATFLRHCSNYELCRHEVEMALKALGLASFSETHMHEPMWAYYAGKFKGMCIEYGVDRLLDGLDDDVEMVRMNYSEEPPMVRGGRQPALERAKMVLSCKAVRWSGEREWRLIQPSHGPASYHRHRAVTAVYLGSRIEPQHEAAIRAGLRPLKIPVRKMKVDSYGLAFERDPAMRRKPALVRSRQNGFARIEEQAARARAA